MKMIYLALAFLAGIALAANARDPEGKYANSPYHDWFVGSKNRNGVSCCTESDGHVLEAPDWRVGENGYEVRIGDKWYPIQEYQLIRNNPTGHAILWWMTSPYDGKPVLYCFAPGTES